MAGFAAAWWYPDTPENHLPLPLIFGFTRGAPSSPDFAVELSPFSRRARSLRLLICSPLHNQPPYVTLGLVATSILILIVARFSP